MEAYTSLWTSSIRGQTEEARRTTVPQWLKQKPFYRKLIMMKEQKVILQMKGQDKTPVQFSSVQLLSRVELFATPWTAARQASLSVTNSRGLLTLTSVESVMPSNHLILCHPLLPLPSIFPSMRVFSSESVFLHQVAKVLEFRLQHQSFQWIFRTDFL